MTRSITLLTLLYCLNTSACLMNKLDEGPSTVELHKAKPGTTATLDIVKGSQWSHVLSAGPLQFNVLPQIAIWMQKSDGTFIDTLYVTGAISGPMVHAGKDKLGSDFWRQCLPAWASRTVHAGNKLPDKETPYSDAVSSATPHGSFSVHTTLPAALGDVDIFAEINKSADYNKVFNEEKTDWVGQPSIVYSVRIPDTSRAGTFLLTPQGYGDTSAKAQINSTLDGIDTALHIVQEIRVVLSDSASVVGASHPASQPQSQPQSQLGM